MKKHEIELSARIFSWRQTKADRWLRSHSGNGYGYLILVFVMSLQAQSLTWLGSFGGNLMAGSDVSPDGTSVAGWSDNTQERGRAFRWTPATGLQDLGDFGGGESFAYGISGDGSIVVGESVSPQGISMPFYYNASTGTLNMLSGLPSMYGAAADVSRDGRVIVGYYLQSGTNRWRAFRWSNNQAQDLGTLGGNESLAYQTSDDGSVVVGWADLATLNRTYHPFIWIVGGSMQSLGTLGGANGQARGLSPDGTIVVGFAQRADGREEAFRWTRGTGIQGLGFLNPGDQMSRAFSVSAQGHIVGQVETSGGQRRAVRWIGNTIEDLNVTYAALLSPPSSLERAYGISPDGRFIVGEGYNAANARREIFLLRTTGGTSDLPFTDRGLPYAVQTLPDRLIISWHTEELIRVELWSLVGHRVATGEGRGQLSFDTQAMPAGVYLCRIHGLDGRSFSHRVVLK